MGKQEKSGLIKGLLVGVILGSFLPDSLNPLAAVKRVFKKDGV